MTPTFVLAAILVLISLFLAGLARQGSKIYLAQAIWLRQQSIIGATATFTQTQLSHPELFELEGLAYDKLPVMDEASRKKLRGLIEFQAQQLQKIYATKIHRHAFIKAFGEGEANALKKMADDSIVSIVAQIWRPLSTWYDFRDFGIESDLYKMIDELSAKFKMDDYR